MSIASPDLSHVKIDRNETTPNEPNGGMGSRIQNMKDVEEVIRKLPPDLQQEVLDFAEFITQRRQDRKQKKLRMSWAGGLREFRDNFTSLDLQKKALEWWGD